MLLIMYVCFFLLCHYTQKQYGQQHHGSLQSLSQVKDLKPLIVFWKHQQAHTQKYEKYQSIVYVYVCAFTLSAPATINILFLMTKSDTTACF